MDRPPHVACPLCGGAVHPIAGRCKHCRADLLEVRRAEPAVAEPVVVPAPAAPRRGWIAAVVVGSVAATAASLWLGMHGASPAARATPVAATPAPGPAPTLHTYRELLEAAVDAGCARLAGCNRTAPCEAARRAIAKPTATCTIDPVAAAACVAAIRTQSCNALDAATWPDGIRALPGCETVCAP